MFASPQLHSILVLRGVPVGRVIRLVSIVAATPCLVAHRLLMLFAAFSRAAEPLPSCYIKEDKHIKQNSGSRLFSDSLLLGHVGRVDVVFLNDRPEFRELGSLGGLSKRSRRSVDSALGFASGESAHFSARPTRVSRSPSVFFWDRLCSWWGVSESLLLAQVNH